MNRPRILVTGGTGFLGKYVVPLLRENFDVDVLSRSHTTELHGDLTLPLAGIPDEKLSPGKYSLMLHMSGLYDLTASKEDCLQQNVHALQTALELAERLQIPFFINTSSVAAAINTVTSTVNPYDLNFSKSFPDPYSESKALGEKKLKESTGIFLKGKVNLRLGVLVGSTLTGEIDRIDGPYHAAEALKKIKPLLETFLTPLFLPGHERTRLPLVPVDKAAEAIVQFCQWTINSKPVGYLSYHLTPSFGPTVREFYLSVLQSLKIAHKGVILLDKIPEFVILKVSKFLVRFPEEQLLYLLHFPTYDSTSTQEVLGRDWCPEFKYYEGMFWRGYRRFGSANLVISRGTRIIRNIKPPRPDFAFVIHALSHQDFMRVPGLSPLKYMPAGWRDPFDRFVAKAPAFVWGRVSHIVSEDTGEEINGIIYTLPATPKALKDADPVDIYKKIETICYDAADRGAKIIGLGAYTKIVGDQGMTINQNSPIPVTTGNSLSASATLWGLFEVVRKMKLLKTDPQTGLIDGMAMVIGATGSIGQVSAKLLSLAFNRVCLVAPRMNRLLDLKNEIQKMAPLCEVTFATDANDLAGEADVLVTATSALDHKIVDVMRLKPGAVVCDCSRPLDFDLEDADKRPDVLIIESGELILPGPVEINCDLGLPGNTVYACLAEAALLTLERRFEPFTLGRDIEWDKVKQIYKMALKHGVQLAAIQGHRGVISDEDITRIRELALSKRRARPLSL